MTAPISIENQNLGGFGDISRFVVLSGADRYLRGSKNLHVHGVVGDSDFCATWRSVAVSEGGAVGVAETSKRGKPVRVQATPARIIRLQSLDDCDRVLESLLVLPFDWWTPNPLPEGREVDAIPFVPWGQSNGEKATSNLARELKPVNLSLVLHSFSHKVWVGADVPVYLKFEVNKVLFGQNDAV